MTNERKREIIDYAQNVRRQWGSDPSRIVEKLGIMICAREEGKPGAHIVKSDIYRDFISMTGCKTEKIKSVLLAHELGHALLHDGVNNFAGHKATMEDDTEYEANLFAVAYLFRERDFDLPFAQMENYTLKGILEYNLR